MSNYTQAEFIPDWTSYMSAEKMNTNLKGFKFSGPGWYYVKDDTLLVIPTKISNVGFAEDAVTTIWHSAQPEDMLYIVHVWNRTDVADAFNAVINAPVREVL